MPLPCHPARCPHPSGCMGHARALRRGTGRGRRRRRRSLPRAAHTPRRSGRRRRQGMLPSYHPRPGVQVGCDPVAAALRREGCNPAHSRVPSLQPYATVAPPFPPQQVDVQSGVAAMGGGMGGGPELARRYTRALEASVAEHFPSNGCINCMCHSTESLYRYRTTAIARASDDFYPDRPESHTVPPRSDATAPYNIDAPCATCPHACACTCMHMHMHAHARTAWVRAGPPGQRRVQLRLHRRDRVARLGHVPLEARGRRAARRRTRGETPPPPATRCDAAAAPMHPPRLQPLCTCPGCSPGAPRLPCDALCRWAAARST